MRFGALALHWVAVGALTCCACSTPNSGQALPTQVRLPAGLAAKVGNDEIALSTVEGIARAQHVPLLAARELAARDAIFAAGARAEFDGGALVAVIERGARARALLERLAAEATASGPVSDAEVNELAAVRWQDFDRPQSVRTTHAIALVAKPEQDAAARVVAQHLYEALRGIQDPQEFIAVAKTVPHEGIEVRAERLPALTRDGRSYYPEGAPPELANQRFDTDFAEGAHRLSVGQVSEPVKSAFGYHVILCEAIFPEHRVPLAGQRRLLTDDVLKGRAERTKQGLLGRLSGATPILITRAVDDLTASVRVTE
ncbi:MAG TPA: peptidyl-prolyl cis-trans isomerase [Polyangiaceae bacterium]|nr:peptidyl-prolyl cis-trans isomerase [Polyangiaceae bacterium]